ncbi:MAG: UDP-N-acetylmuramate dehydrogenase [Flavobacteriales bacterium]
MRLLQNYSLKQLNTFGIDAYSEYFGAFDSIMVLSEMLEQSIAPLTILGGGSNILLTQDIKGTVLKNEIKGITIIEEDNEVATVRVGGGVVWHDFVMWSIEQHLGGIENLSLIPGSVGAAPMQNIGAYGTELKSVFKELTALNINTRAIKTFNNEECKFGYRQSVFKGELKNQFIICEVTFQLSKTHKPNTSYGAIEEELNKSGSEISIQSISQAVVAIRQRKLPDPDKIGNSGSFFKNPTITNAQFNTLKIKFPAIVGYPNGNGHTKVAAGWLIDQAGWKGYRKGDAGVHKHQALVLVNYGKASGKEILQLAKAIQSSVFEKYGIELVPEVNII